MPYNLEIPRFRIPFKRKVFMGLLISGTCNYTSLWHLSYSLLYFNLFWICLLQSFLSLLRAEGKLFMGISLYHSVISQIIGYNFFSYSVKVLPPNLQASLTSEEKINHLHSEPTILHLVNLAYIEILLVLQSGKLSYLCLQKYFNLKCKINGNNNMAFPQEKWWQSLMIS